MTTMVPKRSKKSWRRRRPARKLKIGPALQEKVYRFKFTAPQQYVINDAATTGIISYTGGTLGPIQAFNFTTPNLATSGLPNCYDFGAGFYFNLAQLSNYGAYTSMFDMYKIESIILKMEFLSNTAVVNGNGILPTVYSIIDTDNASVPVSVNAVTARPGFKMMPIGNKSRTTYTIKIVPRQAAIVSDGTRGAPSAVGQVASRAWCDSAYPTIKHFGLKMWFADVNLLNTVATGIKFSWTYNVAFKGALAAY